MSASKGKASPERYRQLTGKEPVSFVNFDFDDSTKKKFKEWASGQVEHICDLMDRITDSGYNLSVKRDVRNQCFSAFLIPSDDKGPNSGLILAGRGGTTVGAIMGALYRHLVVFDGVWARDDIRRIGLDDD